ncbi:MAG: SulP family inorganic anion transporter [Gammaproteobacteria bacterium]|nr:SulP family inorganic anion transporter [Gammaproteobacteria bacterium]MBK6581947.1 SulP family inorganic anion transporter [Gammaproteobacteria bacterium]MBK7170378.1 SulP family inorganic anion transporter [Gammaproteobacteria bacterium]MBK7521789.1 SulP family inorganic anion transporter [Gammaproteobacteria bacterium]MBK8308397.1 SulP family inorganic anion transporter [Gammaproteobacteria bacterium]
MPALLGYRRDDLPHDLIAGLSVAAVALPVGVAYAQLAGFNPVVGLYVSILPLLAYALFGTSRQLIVGPDAATCALVAAAVLPLAGGDPDRYLSLSIALAALTGIFCIGASFLRLGALANFLSKPILVGFLNGISLHIMVGQTGKLFGFAINAQGIVPTLLEVVAKFQQIHWPTLATGLATFAVLLGSARVLPRLPAALVALVFAGLLVVFLGLDTQGVAVIGLVPAGLPTFRLPVFSLDLLDEIAEAAAGLALISFSSMMLTSRSFASRNGYDIDADREFAALGVANIAAALSQGFAISGADSRTAMSDAAGGRTQLTGLVAAGAIALVLLFFTDALRYVPIAALGAVLIKASLSLLDLRTLRELYRLDRTEFVLSVLATLGVIWVGAIQAILVAVMLALLRFVHLTSRPPVEILGEVAGHPGFHSVSRHPDATTQPGMTLFRFNAPLVFFNAPYFKQQAKAAIEAAGAELKWFVVDALPLTQVDLTGYFELQSIAEMLKARGAELIVAGRMTQIREWRQSRGLAERAVVSRYFSSLEDTVQAYRSMAAGAAAVNHVTATGDDATAR